VLMIVTNATGYMGGSDEQGRPVGDEKLSNSRDWRVYIRWRTVNQCRLRNSGSAGVKRLDANETGQIILHALQLVEISVRTVE